MARRHRPKILTAFGILLILCGACAPQAAPREASDGQRSAPANAPAAGPKILNLGVQREPASFEPELIGAAASSAAGGGLQYRPIAQDDLTVPNASGAYEGRLAQEMPTVEKGTWRLNPDGTMDLIWKLRPNVK